MSEIVKIKGTQSNKIPKNKRNTYNVNYKLIVITHVEIYAIMKPQDNSILVNPVFNDGENRRDDFYCAMNVSRTNTTNLGRHCVF